MEEKKLSKEEQNKINLQPGNFTHGFYYAAFLPCNKCKNKENCKKVDQFKDEHGISRCLIEKEFFDSTVETMQKEFQLDNKDIFQLPQVIMNMIKLQRMNKWQADKGMTGKTLIFNPKTGKEHEINTPGVLNRDVYYIQKALLAYFQSLRFTRESRDAKDGIDVLAQMMMGKND